MNRHIRMMGAALLAVPASAMAMGPNYGIAEGIVIGVLAVVVLLWSLSVWIVAKVGGTLWDRPRSAARIGLVYAVVTLTAAGAWAARFYSNAMRHHAEQNEEVAVAKQAHSDACHQRAGEEVLATLAAPTAIYLRIDTNGAMDPFIGLGASSGSSSADPIVRRLSDFPMPRPAGAVFVDARVMSEPIAGVEGRPLRGTLVEVTTAEGKPLARRLDIQRGTEWCLSPEGQAKAVRRFLKRIIGSDIGAPDGEGALAPFEMFSAIGTLGPIEKGHFEHQEGDPASRDAVYPGLTSLIEANGCAIDKARDTITCAKGTPLQNGVGRYGLEAGIPADEGWLSIGRPETGEQLFDMLDVVKRNRDGSIASQWRLRFPAIDRPSATIESATLTGTHLVIDVLFDRETDSAPTAGGASLRRNVFRQRVRLEAELVPGALPAQPIAAARTAASPH